MNYEIARARRRRASREGRVCNYMAGLSQYDDGNFSNDRTPRHGLEFDYAIILCINLHALSIQSRIHAGRCVLE